MILLLLYVQARDALHVLPLLSALSMYHTKLSPTLLYRVVGSWQEGFASAAASDEGFFGESHFLVRVLVVLFCNGVGG